ncbi:MAG: alpha/beta fold hydrolase [Chitinophagales bacterium]|nr:alpha/beta fold hydrolase [Chitinophagales bacterium]
MSTSDWVNRDLFPFTSRYMEIDGHRMHYIDEGSGPVILFSHGTPEWSFGWRDLIRGLRGQFRCVAPDLLGMGLSDKPADADYTCRAHADRMAIFIEKLGLKDYSVIGNDFGLAIGLSQAIRQPENVRNICIFNGWMWRLDTDPHYALAAKLFDNWFGRMLYRQFNFPVNVIMPSVFGNRKKYLTPEVHRHYKMAWPDPASRVATHAFAGQLLRAGDWWEELWQQRHLLEGKLKLIFWGMKDKAIPPYELEKWIQAFPDARVVRCPEAGHFVQEEAPELMVLEVAKAFG